VLTRSLKPASAIDGVPKNDGRDKGGSKSQKLSMTDHQFLQEEKEQLREAVSRPVGRSFYPDGDAQLFT